MQVLIVDDSQATRKLLAGFLKELGVNNVLQAPSVPVALELLNHHEDIRLILTDWHMPGASGLEFLETVKGNPKWKPIPVLMVTSEVAGPNVVAALKAGAANYIIKPFSREQIQEKVKPFVLKAAEESSSALGAVTWGKLGPNELGNVLQFLVQSQKTGVCEVQTRGTSAEIYLDRGRIVGCTFQLQRGEEAFYTCFATAMEQYRFREEAISVPADAAIRNSTHTLLLEALSRADRLRALTDHQVIPAT